MFSGSVVSTPAVKTIAEDGGINCHSPPLEQKQLGLLVGREAKHASLEFDFGNAVALREFYRV